MTPLARALPGALEPSWTDSDREPLHQDSGSPGRALQEPLRRTEEPLLAQWGAAGPGGTEPGLRVSAAGDYSECESPVPAAVRAQCHSAVSGP